MDLDAPVPDPGPPGPYGTMAWLRATVSRLANGPAHARRRALVERELARLDPAALREAAAATRVVAAAYQPHTAHPDADEALEALLGLLPDGEPELVVARVAILVQACEATAGLVRGDDLPVPVTRRIGDTGEIVTVDLAGRPFGAGARRCPGEAHARALVEGVR